MELFDALYRAVDPALIFFFRLPGSPVAGFLCGAAVLCLFCVLLGEALAAPIWLFNRRHYRAQRRELARRHEMSVAAARAGDREGYKALNREASEALGKYGMGQVGLFCVSLWPVPFALGWMEFRFGVVGFELPWLGSGAGVAFVFIPMYAAVRWVFGRLRPVLPGLAALERLKREDAASPASGEPDPRA